MKDLIVPTIDHFSEQANLHYKIRDSLKEVASNFETHFDFVFNQLDHSQAGHYLEWWQKLKAHLLAQADLHDQLGKNLITAGNSYQTADHAIAKSMQGTHLPLDS